MKSITEIQNDPGLRHELFPVTREAIYLAHAGVCPIPKRVQEAITNYAIASTLQDQEDCFDPSLLTSIREKTGQLCGVDASEVALVGPTSNALSMIASGIPFQSGENVVIYYDDYPSNVYPWMALQDKGVEVRHVKPSALGRIEVSDVEKCLDSRTKLVALASCHFLSGYRIDVESIGRMLRERGILFSLDMIQTLGAFDTPLEWVDFAAADSHKWLLGPCAAGVMYVRKEIQSEFNPPVHGWHNVRCPDFVAQPELSFRQDARKYEAGSPNFLGLAGLEVCFTMIHEFGQQAISEALQDHRKYLVDGLLSRGMEVLGDDLESHQSGGMISFYREGLDLPMIHRRLAQEKITISLRRDRSMQQYLRLSPHYYNNVIDFDTFFQALDKVI